MFDPMYVELHCHSAFSFLDGASLPDELVPAALVLGHEALALTDHNTVSGSMEFAVSARALGLRPIHGAEIDLDDGRHLTLLVEDERGWSNLCRLLTRAQRAHARASRDRPPQPSVGARRVLEHHAGPGLPERLRAARGPRRADVAAAAGCVRSRSAAGRAAAPVSDSDDRARNRRLSGLAERLGVPCVATGNVHAHARSRAPLQDAFVAIRTARDA